MGDGSDTSDSEREFVEWLTERMESAMETYHDGPRSENPRQTDIALGKIRAFRAAREEYLERSLHTDS